MKRVLIARSGGGLPGLDMHAGMWQAMEAAGINATHVSGNSAGAIISAFDAAGHSAEQCAKIIRFLTDADVLHERLGWKLRLFWINYFIRSDAIRRLLELYIPPRFDQLAKTLSVVATRVSDGACAWLNPIMCDDVRTAVLASMSICGVFPWVKINGEDYCDGGVRANVPLPGNWREFDEVYICIATRPLDYPKRATGLLSRLMLNVDYYALDQAEDVLAEVEGAPNVHVIWPPLGRGAGTLHFDHSLIGETRRWTSQRLAEIRGEKT